MRLAFLKQKFKPKVVGLTQGLLNCTLIAVLGLPNVTLRNSLKVNNMLLNLLVFFNDFVHLKKFIL
jgi:hypothetical protein